MSWVLTEQDLQDLATGAGILGTGGGGNPYLGHLHVRELVRAGARITVVAASALEDTALICPVGGMGAPTISIERLPNGGEYLGALRAIEAAWGLEVTHVSSIEIGGANALRPMAVAAQAGLPVVDGDGMGRAFPELQMCTFAIAGLPITPLALQDVRGNSLLIRQVTSAHWAEQIARAAVVSMGGSAAMVLFCLQAPPLPPHSDQRDGEPGGTPGSGSASCPGASPGSSRSHPGAVASAAALCGQDS